MYLPTRQTLQSIDPTLSEVMTQAMQGGATVELKLGDHGYRVLIDGVEMAESPSESFDYPLKRLKLSDEAKTLATEYVEKRQRERIRRRIKQLRTDDHSAAEGVETP